MISSNSRVETQFFEVMLKTNPWDASVKSLGLYSTQNLAERVAAFVRDSFMGDFNGGIDVYVENRSTRNKIEKIGEKIRFVDTPSPDRMGAIHTISKALDREEVIRIVDRISTLKEKNQQLYPLSSFPHDYPTSLQSRNCYVMYKLPQKDEIPLGIYSSEKVVHSAANFCSLLSINYDYKLEEKHIAVFSSGRKAAFMQSKNPKQVEDPSLMRVADRLDLFEVKRIIGSLDCQQDEESNDSFFFIDGM